MASNLAMMRLTLMTNSFARNQLMHIRQFLGLADRYTQEKESDSFYDIQTWQVVDMNCFKKYLCLFCSNPAREPTIHGTSPTGCKLVFCKACVEYYVKNYASEIPYCPLRCNGSEWMNAPGAQVPLPLQPRNPDDRNSISQKEMDAMLIKCKYSECVKLVPYCKYRLHIERCIHGRCRICDVSNKDHNCADFVKQLKQQLQKSKQLGLSKDLQIDELKITYKIMKSEILSICLHVVNELESRLNHTRPEINVTTIKHG